MSSEEAVKVLNPYLWEYEKTEILEYETIYFFNVNERKKSRQANGGMPQLMGSNNSKLLNYGFDTEN
jgi:hypothetical protein